MTHIKMLHRFASALLLASAVLAAPATASAAANVFVLNASPAGVGFNDPTPAVPVGGNAGTTLGEQRLIAFQQAADRWGAMLDSNVPIYVYASFEPLGANVLGAAIAWSVFSDFPGAPGFPGASIADTWYPSPLADKRAGEDLEPGMPDIYAVFSSDANWYLGLDANHGAQTDLVTVVMHELGHGLGFATYVDDTTGQNFAGQTDVFAQHTEDATTGVTFSNMATDAERAAAILKVDNLVWDGASVGAAVPYVLKLGRPELNIATPSSIAGAYRIGTAGFGAPLSGAGISGSVTLVNDGVGVPTDACTPLAAGSLSGAIALVDRGSCTFVVKAANVQAAGALAMIVANSAAGDPPPGLGGTDPTLTMTSVMISRALGLGIKSALAGGPVQVTLGIDTTQRAGADPLDRAQLYATNPVQPGSSVSHYDSIAFSNQLMEPAINGDLTHEVIPPFDMTLPLLRDIGWFPDANLDGRPDRGFAFGSCSTRVPNTQLSNGAMLTDQARVWYRDCDATSANHEQFESCVAKTTNAAKRSGLISGTQKGAIQKCAEDEREDDDHDDHGHHGHGPRGHGSR